MERAHGNVAGKRDPDSAMVGEKAPPGAMLKAAAAVGRFRAPATGKRYARLQILTLADLLEGKKPDIP